MARIINDNFKVNVGNPIDSKYLDVTNQPYASVGAVNTAIVESQRYVGLTVNIGNVEYWYGAGVSDGDLVIKDSGIASTGITAANNGLTKSGATVLLGGTLTGATTFTKSGTGSLLKYADDYSTEFDGNTIVDANYASGGTASNGLTKVGRDIRLGGANPLDAATSICGEDNNLNIGTAASKIGALNMNAGSVSVLASGTTEICPTGSLTLEGSSIAVNTVAAYNSSKQPFSALQIPEAQWVTGLTSQAILTADNGLTKDASDKVVFGGTLTGDTCLNTAGNTLRLGITSENAYYAMNSSTPYALTMVKGTNLENLIQSTASNVFVKAQCTSPATQAIINWYPSGCVSIAATNCIKMETSGFTFQDLNSSGGMKYQANYCDDFVDRSLIDKQYVDTAIGNIPSLTYNNGLTKLGDVVSLGGTLTGDTCIDFAALNLDIVDDGGAFGIFLDGLGGGSATFGNQGTTVGEGRLLIDSTTACLDGNELYLQADSQRILLDGTNMEISDGNSLGLIYAGNYSVSGCTNPRWIPDNAYVTGLTSQGFTNATNGLTGVAPNICLGGTLSTDTIINLNNGNCIEFCDLGNNVSYKFDFLGVTLSQCSSSFQITNSGADYSLTHCSGRVVDLDSSGMTYGGNYEACFKPNTLVTKNYVDNATGGIDANNGLSRQGSNIVLGGALTGDSTISGTDLLSITSDFAVACQAYTKFESNSSHIPTTPLEGMLYYSGCSLNFQREVAGVRLQIGEELTFRAENQTGVEIPNGSVVEISGAVGGLPTIILADATATGERTMGITTQAIANNAEGYVTMEGAVNGLNLSAFSVGDMLWLDDTTPGGLSTSQPSYPNDRVMAGLVLDNSDTVGKLQANIIWFPWHVEYGVFTGYTATTATDIGNKLETSVFETYTGDTEATLTGLTAISDVAVTGSCNAICKYDSHNVKLGGSLSEATCIDGAYVLTLCPAQNLCLATTTTKDIGLNAKSNGGIYLKAQEGVVDGSDMTNAVGIALDYNASVPMLVTDNRPVPRGLQYNDDYTGTYNDRSLVDKYYVDSIATGLNVHASVAAATTASDGNQSLSGLTGTIDGVEISGITSVLNRILVKNQTDAAFNGIYSASTGVWGRTEDYDFSPSGEISNGDLIPVISGATLANSQWINISENPIVSGDSINFSVFSQQQGVTGGDGITVSTVGSNREVAVDLAPSNCGLTFDATALSMDYAIYTSGLTTATAGEVQVCACSTAVSATAIPVRFHTDNSLVVDSGDFSYTSADNGLTKVGCNVTLGGTLTGNTIICGGDASAYGLTWDDFRHFNIDFSGSTITDNSGQGYGMRYASDYKSTFLDNSLVSKLFVTDIITGGTTVVNATNGLTKSGNDICWGSTTPMSADSALLRGTTNFCMKNTGIDFLKDCSCVTVVDAQIDMRSCTTAGSLDALVQTCKTGVVSIVGNAASSGVSITAPADGAVYAACYSTGFTSDLSLVDKGYVDAAISSGSIQTANNGLTKDGTNVRLGGTLTGNTTVCGDTVNSLDFGTTGSILSSFGVCASTVGLNGTTTVTGSLTGTGTLNISGATWLDTTLRVDGISTLIGAVNVSGATWLDSTLRVDGASTLIGAVNVSGATHLGDTLIVDSGVTLNTVTTGDVATDCILVWDSNGVVKEVASCTVGITTATNGVSLDGDNFVLGGNLTGATTICSCSFNFKIDGQDSNSTLEFFDSAGVSSGWNIENCVGTNETTATFATCESGGFPSIILKAEDTSSGDEGELRVQGFGTKLIWNSGGTKAAGLFMANASQKFCDQINNKGLEYGGDYEPNFGARSLVTCQYVDSVTSGITGAFTTANNGLCSSGQIVSLGGNALTGDTTIETDAFVFGIQGDVGSNNATISLDASDPSIGLSIVTETAVIAGVSVEEDKSEILQTDFTGQTGSKFTAYSAGSAEMCAIAGTCTTIICATGTELSVSGNATDFGGVEYAACYHDNYSARSLVDAEYVTGITCNGITTANNGLYTTGQEVHLGGTLTGSTCIDAQTDNQFSIVGAKTAQGSASIFMNEDNNLQFTVYTAQTCTGIGSRFYMNPEDATIEVNGAGTDKMMISLDDSNNNKMLVEDSIYDRGLEYAACYHDNYTARSLVDAQYVTGITSGITGAFTTANNGLYSTGQEVHLGGALTGNTTVSGAYTMAFSNTTFNVTATNIGITGILTNTGAIIGTDNLNISGTTWLDSTLRVDGTVTLNSVADGDAETDSVLVRDTSGVVKKVSASELGEDNNIYSMSVVTSNTTLTTGSTYVQLINNASSGLTITLPASPTDGQVFRIKDAAGAALNYPITIARNGKLIDGATNDGILNTDGGALELVYNNSLGSWFVFSFVN